MTDENKFFRYVWRFNAIVLACVAIVLVVSGAFSLLSFWDKPHTVDPVGHFAPVPKAAEQKYTYRLATDRSPVVLGREEIFSLTRWEGEPKAYGLADIRVSSYGGPEIQEVNRLAVNVDGSSHWLFHGYDRMILTENAIFERRPEAASLSGPTVIRAPGSAYDTSPTPATDAPSAVAVVLETVDADTNKDGKITAKDEHSLYVYRAGATEAVKIITADDFLSVQQIGTDKYLVICENGKTATATTFSLPDFKLQSEKPLPNVPK